MGFMSETPRELDRFIWNAGGGDLGTARLRAKPGNRPLHPSQLALQSVWAGPTPDKTTEPEHEEPGATTETS